MAGEDPGASTIAVILDAIQRAWSAIAGSVKAVTSGVIDVVKTSMFFRWRKQMMQGNESKLKHGYQSLKKLRRHEDRGAILESVEIGTREDANLFKKELKRSGIDFAITHGEDGTYTLHYKKANEKDVLHAQYAILEQRYGKDFPEEQQNTVSQNDRDNQQDHVSHDDHAEQTDRDSTTTPSNTHEQGIQEQGRQASEEQSRFESEQAFTARTEEAERTAPQTSFAPSVAETVRAEAQPDLSPQPTRSQETRGGSPLSKNEPVSNEPLSELKRQARERAHAKNRARAISKDQSRSNVHSHRKTRIRARDFEVTH